MTVAKAPSLSTLQWARVGSARRFIRAHATEALTLEGIAREASTSPFHFSRMFRALTGETVFQHVTRVRLRRAVALLVERPPATVTEIAGRVGYESAPSFNKLFRNVLGTTPTRFRALPAADRAALLARLDDPDTTPSDGLDVSDSPEIRERPDRRSTSSACTDTARTRLRARGPSFTGSMA